LLFLIYINGLVNLKISGNIICFADDTLVLIEHKNVDGLYNLANHCINDIKTWLDNNFLELNIKKSKYMYFSINKSNVQFKNIIIHNFKCINNLEICNCYNFEKVSKLKYLGVIFDHNLKWNDHIYYVSNLIKKLFYKYKILKKI